MPFLDCLVLPRPGLIPVHFIFPMHKPLCPRADFLLSGSRGARLIPEMDQIFTEVEMTTLEKVINETWVITG